MKASNCARARAHGVEAGGRPDLARDRCADLREHPERVGLGVPEFAPGLHVVALRCEPVDLGSGRVALGAQLDAELAPILGVDPAVRVVAANPCKALLGRRT